MKESERRARGLPPFQVVWCMLCRRKTNVSMAVRDPKTGSHYCKDHFTKRK